MMNPKSCERSMLNRRFLFAAVVPLLLLADRAAGQAVSGTILGTVHDSSGAAVANAPVAISGAENGVSRNVKSDSGGEYSAPLLPPGLYSISVELQGFKKTT